MIKRNLSNNLEDLNSVELVDMKRNFPIESKILAGKKSLKMAFKDTSVYLTGTCEFENWERICQIKYDIYQLIQN